MALDPLRLIPSLDVHEIGLIYLLSWVCEFHHRSAGICCVFSSRPPPSICGTLITFSESRRRKIERGTFVICMQRESRSYLPNMRAIQCNLAVIGRNVSNLSPRAPYMMDGSFPPQGEAQRSQYEGRENVCLCVSEGRCASSTCSRARSCMSMSALWIHGAGLLPCLCSCFSNLTCWFGRATQELLIQELDVVMWNANSTLPACQTEKRVIFAWDYLCQTPTPPPPPPPPASHGGYRCKLIDRLLYSLRQQRRS